MPGRFLSEAARDRLARFPASVTAEDLHTYFTLRPPDLPPIQAHRQPWNRLGVALQLCAVRYLGFGPDDLTSAPREVVQYVAQQLWLDPTLLTRYGQREQTRPTQLQQVQQYLGYRDASPADLATLAAWLVERAQEHDKPTMLFQLAAEQLRTTKIVRPGITTLERLVASAREQAYKATLQHLTPVLTAERQTWLDGLLSRDEELGRTRFDWLKGRATANRPKAVLAAVARITYLRAAGVAEWDLGVLNPNRRHFLAQLGQKMWSGTLARTPDYRRYPILVAFLHQTLEELIDEILDLFDRYLAEADRTARQKLDDFHRATARATNEKVILFEEVGELVLNPAIADADLRPAIHRQISPEYLRAAVDACKRLRRPRDDNYIDFLAECYPTLRQFTPAVLATLTFRANRSNSSVLAALQVVQQLNATRKRNVPDGAPLGFVPARWYPYLGTASGAISRRYYELCLLWELRTALRAGNIWVEGSRRYADPESYLIPPAEWARWRGEISLLLGAPTAGAQQLQDHAQILT